MSVHAKHHHHHHDAAGHGGGECTTFLFTSESVGEGHPGKQMTLTRRPPHDSWWCVLTT